MGFITDVGLDGLAGTVIGPNLPGLATLWVRLFKNNVTVTRATVQTDLTESTWPGYAAQQLLTFVTSDEPNPHVSEAVYALMTFVRSAGAGSETVYGWYISCDETGNIIQASNFPVPIVMTTAGQTILIEPRLTFQDKST